MVNNRWRGCSEVVKGGGVERWVAEHWACWGISRTGWQHLEGGPSEAILTGGGIA